MPEIVVTGNEIAAFRSDTLPTADAKTIRDFLRRVATTVQDADLNKIQSGFLREVYALVHDLQDRMKRNPRDVKILYGKTKGLAQALEQSELDGSLGPQQYYTGVHELGMLLEDLAAVVKVLTPLLITWQGIGLN